MSTAHGEQVRILEEHGAEEGRGINWWGMIFFISSEALIFANVIAAYLYLEIRQGRWVLPNGEHLEIIFPLINTFILLGSSGPAIIARHGIATAIKTRLIRGVVGAMVIGTIF